MPLPGTGDSHLSELLLHLQQTCHIWAPERDNLQNYPGVASGCQSSVYLLMEITSFLQEMNFMEAIGT